MEKIITEFKPNLSKQSIKVYVNTINKIKNNLDGKDDLKFLKNTKEVIKYLDDLDVSYLTKRNYYNTIIVFMQALKLDLNIIKIYQDERDILNEDYVNNMKNGNYSEKKVINTITKKELDDVIDELEKEVSLLQSNTKFTNKEKHKIQMLFLLKFLVEIPLRNDLANTRIIKYKDYKKLSDEDINSSNYFIYSPKKSFLSLSQYKTQKKYGLKLIDIPKSVMKYFYIWLKAVPDSEYLILNISKHTPATAHDITLLLTKFFKKRINKNISTTIIRSIIVSDKFSDYKKESQDMANIMGHSVGMQQLAYVK